MKLKLIAVTLLACMAAVAAFGQSGDNLLAFREMYKSGTVPSNGTSAVQTLTVGAVSAGTFTLTFEGRTTPAISWANVNATLVNNIDTALETLASIGTNGVAVVAGTITAGANGTITVTFGGNRSKQPVPVMTTNSSGLTGGTITVATTTAGVAADGRSSPRGTLVCAGDTGKWYRNEGTPPNPTWVIMSTP